MPTTSVRRRISRLSGSWGLLDQICRHSSFGKLVNASTPGRAVSRSAATAGSFFSHGVDHAVVLGFHGRGVGLVIDRVQQGLHPRPGCLRGDRHQVRGVVGAAPLPGRAAKPQIVIPAVAPPQLGIFGLTSALPPGPPADRLRVRNLDEAARNGDDTPNAGPHPN